MSPKAIVRRARLLPLLALLAAPVVTVAPADAQAPAGPLKIATIDSDRVVAESARGKAALEKLKTLQDQKVAEGRRLNQELADLRKRMEDGRLSLAPDKLEELRKQIQDKGIALERFQADAQRELEQQRERELAGIERDILAIIDAVGKEQGYTLIFNKFRSGLVFAEDSVDITQQVIQRFDAAPAPRPAGG
jgi:outer membrane protein